VGENLAGYVPIRRKDAVQRLTGLFIAEYPPFVISTPFRSRE
jgi:hypothetical protein